MGFSIGRIEREFILTSLCDKHIPVYLHGQKIRQPGLVEIFDENSVTLLSTRDADGPGWEGFKLGDTARVFYNYYGHTMTFESKILELEDRRMVVKYPGHIIKNLERKYERVSPPEGIELSFMFKGTKVSLNFPKSEEYASVTKPEFAENIDVNNFMELVNRFREKFDFLVSENRIVIFRDKKPENFEETIISRYGKAVYLPSTEFNFPDDEPMTECRVVSRQNMYAFFKEAGVQEHNLPIKLAIYLKNKYEDGINSEIYCPILYQEYVVGYIYLANKGNRRNKLNEDLLEYVYQFSKVLAYSLKIHGYFKGSQQEDISYMADILDISASGLLFAHSSRDLAENLVLYTDFTIILKISQRTVRIPSRLMRKFSEGDLLYFGVLFLEMEPEDFRFLFDFVYGRQFSEEDAQKWEGGADPPEVKLFQE